MIVFSHYIIIGYWISHKAIQCVYDAEDRLVTLTHDYSAVKKLIYDHFKVMSCIIILYSSGYCDCVCMWSIVESQV